MSASRVERSLARPRRISPQGIGWLAMVAAAMTAGLVIYGAWVRVSGSGLGCPDWPLCNGGVVPGGDRAAAIEYGHRLYAGLTMVMVAASAVLGFRRRREVPRAAGFLIAAALLILAQAALGGAVVLTELHGFVRLAHMVIAMGIIGLLTIGGLAILARPGQGGLGRGGSGHMLLAGAGVILIGASIVATSTGFGCLDLPLCRDSTIMSTWLHSLHRVLGVLLFLGVAFVAWRLLRRGERGLLLKTTVGVGLVLIAQISVGAATVALTLPLELRVLHVGLAALIWWGLVGIWSLSSSAIQERA